MDGNKFIITADDVWSFRNRYDPETTKVRGKFFGLIKLSKKDKYILKVLQNSCWNCVNRKGDFLNSIIGDDIRSPLRL